jgi:hypothetical protein
MTVNGSAAASMGAAAGNYLRPHCLARAACVAKTPGKHCVRCAAKTPERRAALSAGLRKGLEANPDRLRAKQDLCRRLAADPVLCAKKTALAKATLSDPERKARHRRSCARGAARRLADPVKGAALRQLGHDFGKPNLRLAYSPEAIAKRGKRISDRLMAWCPQEFRLLNGQLKRQGHLLPARKQIIAERADEIRFAPIDTEAAASHLRKFAPVTRCNATGAQDAVGTHWRYGSQVMTRVEFARLAIRKGFDPQAWARI